MKRKHLLIAFLFSTVIPLTAQSPNQTRLGVQKYLMMLDDARFDVELKALSIFALDDRAPLSSNPHFEAMWNLIRLGASLEAMLQGTDVPLNDIDFNKEFGRNGYNKTILMLLLRFGFGESSDLKIQKHFLELGVSPGFFKEGNGGMHIHLDYRLNLAKTNYGAGGQSLERTFDYEIFAGARAGFDWSFSRSESDAGFFSHLQDEIKRIAAENEFTIAQLLMLENMVESSRILLPEDVGGGAFHIGPIAGARITRRLFRNTRAYLGATGFYDIMDLTSSGKAKEKRRSQHNASLELGFSVTIGGEGKPVNSGSSFF
jgi:hypothetical protein